MTTFHRHLSDIARGPQEPVVQHFEMVAAAHPDLALAARGHQVQVSSSVYLEHWVVGHGYWALADTGPRGCNAPMWQLVVVWEQKYMAWKFGAGLEEYL